MKTIKKSTIYVGKYTNIPMGIRHGICQPDHPGSISKPIGSHLTLESVPFWNRLDAKLDVHIHTRSLTARPWKMVVARRSFPIGKVTFQGWTVKLREAKSIKSLFWGIRYTQLEIPLWPFPLQASCLKFLPNDAADYCIVLWKKMELFWAGNMHDKEQYEQI